jgi:hypothetical protein
MVDHVVAVIVTSLIIYTCQAVVSQLVVIPRALGVNKDMLAPAHRTPRKTAALRWHTMAYESRIIWKLGEASTGLSPDHNFYPANMAERYLFDCSQDYITRDSKGLSELKGVDFIFSMDVMKLKVR